ncbi:glutathione S-transferase family protein [Bacteriovorax sp. DB6_IX]|uniref:glutathione S-transferase family protein n=1 Tax=Bacteriovorax sp. DB6_IX TaxID=1353530 RepID=UPI000389E8FA|nr:glutathione S-transferase N-terminal domain-containing protein [Bacteriovorax sp. DB6_IX]EQC50694.1 glutathione S-transferase, N-terminal domain protein [Bacteriovorax sp. DB6_IX]
MRKPILMGSVASPFVRRIRLLLDDADYDFQIINVMSQEGQEELAKHSRTRRVPVFLDGELEIFDSPIIAAHVLRREFSLDEKLFMKEVDELTDAGLLLYQMKVFNLDPKRESKMAKIIEGRLLRILSYLNEASVELGDELGLKEIWLYTTLDWFKFRSVQDWGVYENLVKFHQKFTSNENIVKTAP